MAIKIYDKKLSEWKDITDLVWNEGAQAWEKRRKILSLCLLQNGIKTEHGLLSAEAGVTQGNDNGLKPTVASSSGGLSMHMPYHDIQSNGYNNVGSVYLAKGLDVTRYKMARVEYSSWKVGSAYAYAWLYVGSERIGVVGINNRVDVNYTGDGTIDLSGIDGKVDVFVSFMSRQPQHCSCVSQITLQDLWIE